MALLEVRQLSTVLRTRAGVVAAVDDVSFDVGEGEALALVGESGCGKTMTARSILRLVPRPPAEIVGGEVLWKGEDLLRCSEDRLRQVRGAEISMIFQEPMTSLNPVLTVGEQIAEVVRTHLKLPKKAVDDLTVDMLNRMQIVPAARRRRDYPHQFSGGMRQRVMIAMALALSPALLIADEPSTALDVTVQAQIFDLLAQAREDLGMALLLITHNLALVADVADRVAVMYAGEIMEISPCRQFFESPRHPYAEGLLHAIPSAELDQERLYEIRGTVPSLINLPAGCYFAPRCPLATKQCRESKPPLEKRSDGRSVRCWHR